MLTVNQVASRLKCSSSLVYALCAEGKLAHHRLGNRRGTIRITEDQLAQFLKYTESREPRTPTVLKHIQLKGFAALPERRPASSGLSLPKGAGSDA